jgi:hypothetical protein
VFVLLFIFLGRDYPNLTKRNKISNCAFLRLAKNEKEVNSMKNVREQLSNTTKHAQMASASEETGFSGKSAHSI